MPELPEVEVVRAGLDPAVAGATVLGVTVLDERALTRYSGSGSQFEAALTGRTPAKRRAARQVPVDTAGTGRRGCSAPTRRSSRTSA